MVSIPSSQIKNIIYFDQGLGNHNLKKLKTKFKTKSIFKDAENKGYFLNITAQYLNIRFNGKGRYYSLSENENINELKQIMYIDLHQNKIQRLMCLEYCKNIVYLNISNNSISDISTLRSCQNLIILDVSSNVIEELPEFTFWNGLKALRALYLQDNPISEPDSVAGLCGAANLLVLTSSNTPLSLKRKYRHFLVNSIWSLKVLDNYFVSDEEIIEDANFKQSKYRSQSPALRFPSHFVYRESDSSNITAVLRKFVMEINQAASHLSPVIIIQKWVRGFLCRRKHKMVNKHSQTPKPSIHSMPKLFEEKPSINHGAKDNVKYLSIDLKHLQSSLTIETLDRESFLVDSLAPTYNTYTYRSVAKSDQDKCSKDNISRALEKEREQHSTRIVQRMEPEISDSFTFRLMGVNPPSTNKEPSAEVTIEKSRSHYLIREADRLYHENKLTSILPEIKSKPVTRTNSNILFQKSQGCMGMFLLNKWDKTDQAVAEMDLYHDKVAKVESVKYERELKQQDLSKAHLKKLALIKRSHDEHKNHVSLVTKLEHEIHQMNTEDLRTKQEYNDRIKSKIKKEICFSLNFRAKQTAASNAIDRFERMAIKQDQAQANVSTVTDIRENIGIKMDGIKSYIQNQLSNRRMERTLEKSALDMQLFQQMNSRMNEAKMRVEKLKTIHRLVSCPKLKVFEVALEPLPMT